MLKLKKGDVIKNKSDNSIRVLATIDGVSYLESLITGQRGWYTDSEIEANFILPKEKWVPKEGEKYFHFDECSGIFSRLFRDKYNDRLRIEFGNCFQTEAEAQKVVEEIKKILNK